MGKVKDLKGKTFGRLTVLERKENNSEGRTMWLCQCSCGNQCIVIGKLLSTGHTKSCGCLNREMTSKACLDDLTGKKFNMLTVVSRSEDYVSPSGRHLVKWNCLCDCGNKTVVTASQLKSGKTKSCGCLHIGNYIHGGRYDRLYRVYANMKSRCYNKNNKSYKYYGGRGISICDEWLSSYSSFKEWSYRNGYDKNAEFGQCTIDRINVDSNYEPSNCRWVSMKEQSENKRNNKSNK